MAETLNAEIPSTSNGSEVLETREWIDSLDYVLSAGRPGAGRKAVAATFAARPPRGRRKPALHRHYPYVNTIPPRQQPPFPGQPGDGAAHQEPGALERAGHGGRPTRCRRASAGIFRPTPPRPPFMKWRSTIFCARAPRMATGISFIFRDMPRPGCIPAPSSKAAFRRRSCRTSAAS